MKIRIYDAVVILCMCSGEGVELYAGLILAISLTEPSVLVSYNLTEPDRKTATTIKDVIKP